MSKLLDEAHRLEAEALDALYSSYKMPFEGGYFQGVEDMRKLIEKHEEPKGLLQVAPPEWVNKHLILNEEQQDVYETLIAYYKYNARNYFKDDDNIISTLDEVITNYEINDRDFVPALNKFLKEVQE